jgi:hypothetical protein
MKGRVHKPGIQIRPYKERENLMRNISKEMSHILGERIVYKTKCKYLILFVVAALTALLYPPLASASILGSAESFAVLGGSTVTNTGTTNITGNLGVSPGSAVTGFPPGLVVGGTIHAGADDAVAIKAQIDLTKAYNDLAGMSDNSNLTGQDLGGLTLTPGVYKFDLAAQLTGTLRLNAQGNENAFWVFQIGSTLTTADKSWVNVINLDSNNGKYDGLYWQVGSSATLGTGTRFEGNIVALTSITLNTGATILNGRALARNGAVTLDTNDIIAPVPVPATILLLGPALACLGLLRRRSTK